MAGDLKAAGLFFPLFVPATRPERIDKARATAATCVIADLEDAVAPDEKDAAREALAQYLLPATGGVLPVCVRINGDGTPWFDDDLALVARAGVAGVVLPKAETPEQAQALRRALPASTALFGLVETALGLANVRALAPMFDRLMFGSLDFAADLGCAHSPAALAHPRAEIALASRLAGIPGPVDGVTTDTQNAALIELEAALGAGFGFKGKLLIHPNQIAPAKRAYRPDAAEIDWASRVVALAGGSGVAKVDGMMVDAPVIAQARAVLARAADTDEG